MRCGLPHHVLAHVGIPGLLPRYWESTNLTCTCHFQSCLLPLLSQEERIKTYKAFKEGSKRILVATDLVGRGIDIERVNIVINYDMPETDDVSAD